MVKQSVPASRLATWFAGKLPLSIIQSQPAPILGFAIAAFFLYGLQLGAVPLRDWDEGTIAQVAKEMIQGGHWIYPTLYGAPYLNKPPFVEWLITIGYQIGGINAGAARGLPALISALSVPLLYAVGREVFARPAPAVCSAAVYLTLLPVVRHGRLAMRDGVAVTLFLLLLWCLLKARRQPRWALGAGLALGLLALTKGILAILLGGIAALFLLVHRQWHLLRSPFLWGGLALGSLPAIAWYGLQLHHYGATFWQGHVVSQSFSRVWDAVDNHQAPPWYYLLELVKYSWPWLLFYPSGLVLACKARSQPWAQLILVGTLGYLGTISIMTTKLPWYIMPLYPFVALTIGAQLGQIWQQKFSNHGAYYRLWSWLLALIAIAALGAGAYLSWTDHLPLLLPIGIILSGTSALAAWWIRQRDRRFIPALVAGLYVTLTLFVCSDVWLWELNEAYAVQPVAALVKSHTPPQATVFTTFAYHRPSLDFYSDRHVLPIAVSDLPAQWQPQRYLLIQAELAPQLTPLPHRVLAAADGWLLVSHNTINQSSP